MKKLVMILFAATAFSCGDGNRSSERDNDLDNDNTELAEPDTTNVDTDGGRDNSRMESDDRLKSDTTSTWDRDRDNHHGPDSLSN